jgi:RNA polymerase sporulation-specific sigma factor
MEELLITCEPLIKSIANTFYNVEKEDLIQAGRIGLIEAYKHYDKNSNVKFSTFAYSYIFGQMYNLSIKSNPIKTNKDNLKILKLINKTYNYLSQTLNKTPSLYDISSYLNIDIDTINNVYNSSLSTLDIDDNDNTYITYDNDMKIDLNNSINTLSDNEQALIKYRYFNDLTQSEVANIMNTSQVSISRQEKKSLKKLRQLITE